MLQEINKQLLIYLNSLGEIRIVEYAVSLFADGPIFFLPLFLIWAWIYARYWKHHPSNSSHPTSLLDETETRKNIEIKTKQNLLLIFYSCVIAITISLIIQQIIHIPRPETAIIWVGKLLLEHIPDASFPSDHASVSVAFLAGLFYANYKKIAYTFLPFVCLMNLFRIIAWVHWPFDIIVWTLVWITWAFISFRYCKKLSLVKKLNHCIIQLIRKIKL